MLMGVGCVESFGLIGVLVGELWCMVVCWIVCLVFLWFVLVMFLFWVLLVLGCLWFSLGKWGMRGGGCV